MSTILHLKSIAELGSFTPFTLKHPLVAVVDFSSFEDQLDGEVRISADFYAVMFKNYCADNLRYGRRPFDFQEGSLMCVAPKQILSMDNEVEPRQDKMGWGLFFHPDLLRGSALGSKMAEYTYFGYEVSEALHLSDKEKNVLHDCVQNIENELLENIDNHSQTLIVSNIELLLNYCARYYGRQFITRKNVHSDVLSRVDTYLREHFRGDNHRKPGLPTVKNLADHVNLSASYLSDLLKKETGMHAQDHIHYQLIEEAKNVLISTDHSVSEVAYALGFEYPQYFSKLFKKKTGYSPAEFRNLN